MNRPGPPRVRASILNVVLVVVILAVLAGTAALLTVGRTGADTAVAPRTVPVGRGTVARTVTAAGTVVSATTSSVGFSTGGTVTDVRVGLGDRVVEGQVLATIDDDSARANLDAARANLTAARRQLDDAEGGGQAGGTGAPSGSETQRAQSRAQVAQAEATVIDAQRSVDGTELTAPQSGTVVSLDGRVGQTVGGTGTQVTSSGSGSPSAGTPTGGSGSGATSGSGAPSGSESGPASGGSGSGGSGSGTQPSSSTAFLQLADLDDLRVDAQLPELDVGQVADGQSVAVSVNALPGRSLRGVVAGVDSLPGSGASVQYGTTIGLEGRPPGLRLGQSASVAITTARADRALFLPNAAVEPLGGPGATQGSVLVYAGGRQERRTVGLGIAADTVTQITDGLSVGDLVVLPEPAVTNPFQDGGGPPGGSGPDDGSDDGSGSGSGDGSGGGSGGSGGGGGGG